MIARRPTRHSAWQECLNANHVTMTALRAVAQGLAGKQLVVVVVVQRHIREFRNGRGFGEQLPAPGQLGRAMTVGQETIMPNPLESARQNVQQEAADARAEAE